MSAAAELQLRAWLARRAEARIAVNAALDARLTELGARIEAARARNS